jgi:hypothetical protein
MSKHDTTATSAPQEPKEFGSDTCGSCGRRIDTTQWRPATTGRDDTGQYRVYVFCDEDCRDHWSND